MPDRNHVIATLEYCLEHGSMGGRDCWTHCDSNGNITHSNARDNCPNGKCVTGCVVTPIREAIELLKAQEPRVMTLEEIPYAVFGWMEIFGQLIPCVLEDVYADDTVGFANLDDGHDYICASDYNKAWRCWTSRPTDEQREAEPWQE